MRILFDGFWWSSGPYSNRQVLREFVFGWERLYPGDELIVAVRHSAAEGARAELPARVEVVTTRLAPQGISAILELPFLARKVRADLTLTHNFSPLWGRSAVFVHDLMFETSPEWFTGRERAYFSLMTRTLPRATTVFTSSATEALRIEKEGRPRAAVVPVGLGFPPGLELTTPKAPAEVEGVDSFLLVVGRLNVRKNLANALEAAVRSGRVDPRHPIVVVGEPSGKGAELPPEVVAAMDDGSVRFTGFISDDELAWLYGHTSLFLFLSLDEGFGIPCLEALYFGAPVLASDIPVFREVLGGRATFVDPLSVDAISDAIALCLDRTAGAARPQPVRSEELGYSWDESVRRLRSAIVSV
ncbi:glycosyltransferase family 1 protein [soil metagenome]